MQKLLPLFLYLLCFSFPVLGQEYLTTIRHYNLEKGLETRDFRFCIKDSQGFIWFTSQDGAYRFDGNEFKNYKRKTDNSEPYALMFLQEDSDKNIWFSHQSEGTIISDFSILPFGKDSLVAFEDFFKDKVPYPREDLYNVIFRPPHFIGLIYKDGELYEYTNGKFHHFFTLPNFNNLLNTKYFLGKIDFLKNIDHSYSIIYQKELLTISSEKELISKESLPTEIMQINQNEKGNIWLNFYGDILFKENPSAPLEKVSFLKDKFYLENSLPSNNDLSSNYVVIKNNTPTYDLTLFDLENGEEINIEPFGIPETNISAYSYFVENKNSIWLNTHDGIYHIQLNKKIFNNYLQGESTRKIVKRENGDVWVASNSGLHQFNLNEPAPEIKTHEEWKYGRNMLWENEDEFWLGSLYSKVLKGNASQQKTKKEYIIDNDAPTAIDVNAIHRDKKTNQLWLGTSAGMFRYDEKQDSFLHFRNNLIYNEFDFTGIYQIFENENQILLASSKGIFEFHPSEGLVQIFSTKNNTLPYDNIVFIHQDKVDKTYWLGTKLGGLIHWDKKNNIFKVFTIKDGLSDNLIYAVYEDDDGFLWLPSDKGLMRFDKKTNDVITLTTQDGLPYDEFNYYSHYQDDAGNLYFGGLSGITTFHPKDVIIERKSSPLHLTDLEIYDAEKGEITSRWQSFRKNKNITLRPSEKYFRLTLALLDFKKPEGNQYFYKIEGLDKYWKPIDENILTINSLPHGQFNLLIEAQNSNDYFSEDQLNIPIHVQKPFYLEWWFLITMVVLAATFLRLIVYRRTFNLQKEKEKLEQEVARRTEEIEHDKTVIQHQAEELKKLDKIKTQFFANVTHELRTPLTLIIGPLKQLMKSENLDDKTMRTLTTIAQNGEQLKNLVEEILDLSRYDAKKLEVNKKSVHFLSEVRKWAMGFDLEAQQRGIDFQLLYQLPIDLHLKVDTKKLEKITTNLLSNAFKHTQAGDSIIFEISEKEDSILLKVIDSGEGIREEDLPHIFERFFQAKQSDSQLHGGLGIGLALSKELANLMEGKLSVDSTLGHGSVFTLEIAREVAEKIILPKEKNGEKVFDAKGKLLQSIPSKSKRNILIVEDNTAMQVFIQELLHPFANITIAHNGKDALRILNTSTCEISLIVSDVMMPEMDGFTMLEKLKNDKDFQLIPTIMLTALGDIGHKLKALRIGVDDYLVKPFEPEELIARVNTLLENNEMRKVQPVPAGKFEIKGDLPEEDSANMKWLKNLEVVAFENITKPNFNVGQLAHEIALGERQLNRRLKKMTGLTPGNYLKEIKLQKARQLLENKAYATVAEIAYLIGFTTPEYFSKVYKKRFGKLPSEYLK